jgi:general secretion pathway protein D
MGMSMLNRHTTIACLLMASMGLSAPVWAQTKPAAAPITLNFVNAEIEAVARTLASLTKRSLVVDPRVKGTITLSTDKPVSAQVAWNQFLAVLRLQGFAVIETQGLFKVVPEAEAKLQGGQDAVVAKGTPNNAQVMTQIFKLNHENANNLVAVLRPLISPNNTINVTPGSNALVITDYADNLQRLGKIIAALDVANATDVEVIPLKHAIASDMAALLSRLVETGGAAAAAGQADTGYKTSILAEARSNAIIVRSANPAKQAQVRSLIEKLDRPGSELANGNIHVVYLKNADATKLANTLRAAMSANSGSAASSLTPTPAATPSGSASSASSASALSNLPSTGGQIQADAATNSLIISAPEPQYRQLRAVIDSLDQRRAQVLVESLIVEVDSAKESQFGIQWQNLMGSSSAANVGVLGTNFATNNLLSLSSNPSAAGVSQGLNIGSARKIDGRYIMTSLANFLQTNGGSNILSRPSLLTLDNEEAKIVVGQNVPFVTGQYTSNNSNSGSVNPFQTVERKDVGLTLKVKPQISDTGTVKLTIYQEVSSVNSSRKDIDGLVTNKRSIESNILVADGAVVVLGGLLSDNYEDSRQQVPGLGDMPFFGNLFRNESRSRNKTNLMIFLRPVVVRDDNSAEVLSSGRYEQMQGLQKDADKPETPVLPVPNDQVLPPFPRKDSAPAN